MTTRSRAVKPLVKLTLAGRGATGRYRGCRCSSPPSDTQSSIIALGRVSETRPHDVVVKREIAELTSAIGMAAAG
jgi:hypothetical protein